MIGAHSGTEVTTTRLHLKSSNALASNLGQRYLEIQD